MVNCSACHVNTIDRHCTNTPQTCYACCTSHATIPTCPAHYQQMGNTDAAARLAAGLVHPSIDAVDAAESQSAEARRNLDPPGGADAAAGSAALDSGAPQRQPALAQTVEHSHPNPAPAAPAATASSVAALRARMDADRAVAEATAAALQAQLQQILSLLRNPQPAAAVASPPAAAPTATAAMNAAVNTTQPNAPPVSSPPPHRSAVLDRSTAIPPSANTFASLGDDGLSDSDDEVIPQSHTMLLPPAFRPTQAGTEQSAQQQLAAIVDSLSKQTGKVKYASFAELNEALDDWAESGIAAGWSAERINAIRLYQQQLVHRFPMDGMSLKVVLEYHRKWCKAAANGKFDMFAPDTARNLDILYDVQHPQQFGIAATSTASTAAAGKTGKVKKPASAAGSDAKPATPRHPAGSCTKHPASTSHTTAECRLK